MKVLPCLLALGAMAALLTGCGSSGEAGTEGAEAQPEPPHSSNGQPQSSSEPRRKLRITLNGRPGPETAGVLLAERFGYFADVGLKAFITHPASPALPITYAADGGSDVVVTQEPELVLARDEGFPLLAFGSLISRSTMAMIWLKGSGIHSIADLKGKTIAYPGVATQKDFLESVLASAGLELSEVKLKAVGYDLAPTLENGHADAIFGGSATVEGASLE